MRKGWTRKEKSKKKGRFVCYIVSRDSGFSNLSKGEGRRDTGLNIIFASLQ